jgi:DNA-binding MarR family transcriptional regulator
VPLSAPPTDAPAATETPRHDDVGEMAARLRLSATRLGRRLRREAESDLSPTLGSALAAIHVHGPVTLGDLADHERVSPPTVTKVVNKLEDQGLVVRIVDPADRRICRVECTVAGAELIEQSRQRKNAWLAARIDELDPERRERLAAALDVLDELASGGPA